MIHPEKINAGGGSEKVYKLNDPLIYTLFDDFKIDRQTAESENIDDRTRGRNVGYVIADYRIYYSDTV